MQNPPWSRRLSSSARSELILPSDLARMRRPTIHFIVSAHRQQQNLFLTRLWILDELEENTVIIVHRAGPRTSQLPLQLVTMQRGMKGVLSKLL